MSIKYTNIKKLLLDPLQLVYFVLFKQTKCKFSCFGNTEAQFFCIFFYKKQKKQIGYRVYGTKNIFWEETVIKNVEKFGWQEFSFKKLL